MPANTYEQMITAAILGLKARGGCSRPALKKWILENNDDISLDAFARSIRAAIKKGVEKGTFVQTKQKFKLSDAAKAAAIKAAKPKKIAKKMKATKKKATKKKTTKKKAGTKKKTTTKKKATKKKATKKKAKFRSPRNDHGISRKSGVEFWSSF